jgi:tetratricopeptide (TPR) repeat protein
MHTRFRLVLFILIMAINPSLVYALDDLGCGGLEPKSGVDKELEKQFRGEANILFKRLGSGEVENKFRDFEKDAVAKYPNSDELFRFERALYMFCILVANSRLSDEEKIKQYKEVVVILSKGKPSESRVDTQTQDKDYEQKRSLETIPNITMENIPANTTDLKTNVFLSRGDKYYRVAQYEAALAFFQESASLGNGVAMNRIGYMYEKGIGVPQDYQTALEWYRKGAEAGDGGAMANVGYVYENGLGVPQDYAEALKWYRKSAELGEPWAMAQLCYMYITGVGLRKDYAEALPWCRKGAEAGDGRAMGDLAYFYQYGLVVPQDYQTALEWYRKGAEAGNAGSMTNIGHMYEKGIGVPQNYQTALQWYRKAAEAGDDWSKKRLEELGEKL